jgi:phospholipase C
LPPLYNQPSFVRHLDAHGVSWRWYSSDVGTLRMADQLYSLGHHDRFAYFTKTGLPGKAELNVRVQSEDASFLEDAARGTLPSVSWIDPNWGNFNPFGFQQNDDHPPADIKDGQDLVLAVYHAVATGPQWDKTLLVIFYDEHGGFFDHVPPPEAADDDPQTFGRYGVRVPALIVSPWIEPGSVSHTLFDHTSIIKTILLRFCPASMDEQQPAAARPARLGPQYPGLRVAQASHLGELLTRTTPRPAQPRDALLRQAAARAGDAGQAAAGPETGDYPLNDLQQGILAAMHELRRRGHPPDAP